MLKSGQITDLIKKLSGEEEEEEMESQTNQPMSANGLVWVSSCKPHPLIIVSRFFNMFKYSIDS